MYGKLRARPCQRRWFSWDQPTIINKQKKKKEDKDLRRRGEGGEQKGGDPDHNRQEWLLELLVQHLGANINSRQPAAISRVAVIPSDGVLDPAHLLDEAEVLDHVLVPLLLGVDTGLSSLHRKGEDVHHNHRVIMHLALHKPHHLNVPSGAGMHHLQTDIRRRTGGHFIRITSLFSPPPFSPLPLPFSEEEEEEEEEEEGPGMCGERGTEEPSSKMMATYHFDKGNCGNLDFLEVVGTDTQERETLVEMRQEMS